MAKVGLSRGKSSYEAVRKALDLLSGDVQIPKDKLILVKPNMVSDTIELAATPVDAVRAVLDFLKEMGAKNLIIGEATAGPEGNTMGAFERFGYLPLQDEYGIELRDLNKDDHIVFEAFDADLTPVDIRVNKTFFESYVVPVARMKTHLQAIVTLSIKNIAISSIHNPDRHSLAWHDPEPNKFSHDPKPINLYLARLAHTIMPELAVVDGVVGMENKGPVAGTPVKSGVALAGTNALAVDIIGSELMGFDYRTVGYLWYLSQIMEMEREDIQVVGERPQDCVTRYKPYEKMQAILTWWVENWKELLHGDYIKSPMGKDRQYISV
ncbi:MAG: DUF362 domain-containing protein [Spirochaetales bacterium]|nr:DUF362 domain-containing protein [Spirochaetales bacterium]